MPFSFFKKKNRGVAPIKNPSRQQPFAPKPIGPEPEPIGAGVTPVVIMNGAGEVLHQTAPIASIAPVLPGAKPLTRAPNNGHNVYVPFHSA